MANPIDLIITKQALDVVDSAIAKVNLLDKTMQEATQHFIDNSKKMASSTPSGVNGNAENNAVVTAQLKTQADTIAKLSKELENLNQKLLKLNETKATNKKLTIEETVANQALRKSAVEEAKANSELIGTYEKLNIKHQQAVRNAQNLGATYGSTSKEFIKASEAANILDKELKDIDSTLGKNTRNVGNYKSGFNALGNSINQLSREAPAFANSVNTGFMAISNNIPAFTDALKGIREENARLKAEGQPTVSVFKQLATGIFSWQTLISVGVTLLTLYGGKLVDMARGLGDVEAAVKSLTAAQEASNKEIANTNANIDHQVKLEKERAKQ
jgi:chromosome segregation ATPase